MFLKSAKILFLPLLSTLIVLCSCAGNGDPAITIIYDFDSPEIEFAVDEIILSLKSTDYKFETKTIDTDIDELTGNLIIIGERSEKIISEGIDHSRHNPDELSAEGFMISKEKTGDNNTIWIAGADPAGAMYGGQELAEQIRIYGLGEVREIKRNPYMKMRGVKFNIPLDVRTPSYSDPSDAAQNNMPEIWDFEFWKEYLDNLARFRYNYVSLWSLHPFPSMVKVPDYPDVALDDVQRSTIEWEEYYDLNGTGFDAPEIVSNVEVLKEISIEEKMDFWRKVMSYGKSRNIDFYIITWNIFVNGTNGKYNITDDIDNEITRDYFRKSVRQLLISYPDLAGIGLTTGENMKGASTDQKEDWAFNTYALGMMDVAKEQPERKFKFIHRQHQTGALEIADRFREVIEVENIDFLFSYKYAKAHVFSSTIQPFCNDFVEEIKGMKTIWTLRNDDSYIFRWGAPEFVREFIKNIPYDVSEGFYYGSDQWIWGREFLSLDPEQPRQIEIDKHWYHWSIWGRLGYDPEIPDERFMAILDKRFPQVKGSDLFTAWQEASMIYPLTTGFHWGPLDFRWYIEGCKSHPRASENETGFHDVNRFISLPPHPGRNFQSIPDHTEMISSGGETDLKTPIEVSEQLHAHADKAMELLENLNPGENKELMNTLADIRAVAYLGKYYAYKISGAAKLDLYRKIDKDSNVRQENAIKDLTSASEYWKLYYSTAQQQYKNPLWTNRVGHVNWEQIYKWVLDDIDIARENN